MNTYEIDLGPFGKGYADTSYQNNIFQVGWGERVNSKVVYHSYNLLNISFEGNWHCSYFRLDNGTDTFSNAIYCNNGTESNLQLLPKGLMKCAIDGIINCPELKEKLIKWKKDVVKRLKVSVPRLKSEYEGAKARLELLENNDFSH